MPMQHSFVPPSTAAELRNATLKQLQHWARQINDTSSHHFGTKPIKTLKLPKEDLLKALADHLGIDLSIPATGQLSADGLDIKPNITATARALTNDQWGDWLAWGHDWANQEPYMFSSDSEQPQYHPLPVIIAQRYCSCYRP